MTLYPSPATGAGDPAYLPLVDTLRLYAGWLLAWYAVVYFVGYETLNGRIAMDVPFLDELFGSALVLSFAFGTFLFLLLTTLKRAVRGGMLTGFVLTLAGIAGFAVFSANV